MSAPKCLKCRYPGDPSHPKEIEIGSNIVAVLPNGERIVGKITAIDEFTDAFTVVIRRPTHPIGDQT